MYTIRQVASMTGVAPSTLRAWERRYGVVSPDRTEGGYRIYDDSSVAAVLAMRELVDAGWAPAQAARAVREGTAAVPTDAAEPAAGGTGTSGPDAARYTADFLASARLMDTHAMEQSLDGGFALGSFEWVVDSWLLPTLRAMGEAWARGEVSISGEHAASHAVHRRLSAAFAAAASRPRGPAVVVGLPPGGRHELGALAFATALRRRGHHVLYLGADVPVQSWLEAARTHRAVAAVLSVTMAADRPGAVAVAERLGAADPGLLVASGGAAGSGLAASVTTLPASIESAAQRLDELLHGEAP